MPASDQARRADPKAPVHHLPAAVGALVDAAEREPRCRGLALLEVLPSSGTTTLNVQALDRAVAGPLEELPLGEAGDLGAAHGLVDAAEHLRRRRLCAASRCRSRSRCRRR